MRVLAACETSGMVRRAFTAYGHDVWSCDLLPADDMSDKHLIEDCCICISRGWDLIIAHPPCTHLCVSGARHFAAKRADGRQKQGIDLFMSVVDGCNKYSPSWAIENPIGIMSRLYRKPDQIIQPWQYGHGETKATCLWLNNLPLLTPTAVVEGRENRCHRMPPSKDRWKKRSATYPGIAVAIAQQWGNAAAQQKVMES